MTGIRVVSRRCRHRAETVLAGHHDVEDHEVDRRRLQCPSGGGAPVDHGDAHVVPFQVSPQRFANLPVVVDHEHVRRGFHALQAYAAIRGEEQEKM